MTDIYRRTERALQTAKYTIYVTAVRMIDDANDVARDGLSFDSPQRGDGVERQCPAR